MTVQQRIDGVDWARTTKDLDMYGHAVLAKLFTAEECLELVRAYTDASRYRRTIEMSRYGFGRGTYHYYAEPLPPLVQAFREHLYPPLAEIARCWGEHLDDPTPYPQTLTEYRQVCHRAGQTEPTPVILRYGPGDQNGLHQDVYGSVGFPLQAAILLSQPGEDFTGGEFVVVEESASKQPRVEVVSLERGDAVIFANQLRPVATSAGFASVNMKHGTGRVRTGLRFCLGLIFHDAKIDDDNYLVTVSD